MDIKYTSAARCMLCLATLCYASQELNTNVSIGMQTNDRELGFREAGSKLINNAKQRSELFDTLRYDQYEYLNIELNYGLTFFDDLSLKVFTDIDLNRVDLGTRLQIASPLHSGSVEFSTFLNAYRSIYYDDVVFSDDYPIDVDFGINADVNIQDDAYMFLTVRQPMMEGHHVDLGKGLGTASIDNKLNFSIGVRYKHDWMQEESENSFDVIQEPIKISPSAIEELPFDHAEDDLIAEDEASGLDEDVVVESEAIDVVEPVAEEESMGWFAWLIEFIAKLFRF